MILIILLLAIGLGSAIIVPLAIYIVSKKQKKRSGAEHKDQLVKDLVNEKNKSDIIFNAIDDGVVLVDEKGIIRAFNPAGARITGWPVEEATGINALTVIALVDGKNQLYASGTHPLEKIVTSTTALRDNTGFLRTRSNKQVAVFMSVSPLFNASQQFTGAVCVFRDVTQERNEEKQRAEFISTASHEMRTPVAAIEGYLALALNDKVCQIDAKAKEYLEKAHQSTDHLGKLFQDLLTAAKSEDGRLSSHPVVVEMGSFVERLAEDMKFAAEKKGLSVEFVLGSQKADIDASQPSGSTHKVLRPLYYVVADPDRMHESITNLFDNAVKYTESGKITLGLTGNNEVVQFSISDTGAGIPTEDIPHLFQKFYRVDNSATRTIGGTGLGLFLSRKIVELYNGHIWVESTLGKGSTFYINLPRITSDRAKALQAKEAASGTLAPITSIASSSI